MRVLYAAAMIALLAGPALAQAEKPIPKYGEEDKDKTPAEIEAAKNAETISVIASRHNVHPNQVSQWKKMLYSGAEQLFADQRKTAPSAQQASEAELYEQIGRLKMELEWLKKKSSQLE